MTLFARSSAEDVFTSTNDVMSYPAFVCLSFSLTVSNFNLKTADENPMKIIPDRTG